MKPSCFESLRSTFFEMVDKFHIINLKLMKLIWIGFVLDSKNHAWVNVIQLVYKGKII